MTRTKILWQLMTTKDGCFVAHTQSDLDLVCAVLREKGIEPEVYYPIRPANAGPRTPQTAVINYKKA